MIKKINQYLLTHKPILWNTRIVWILAINFILHFFFFISGFLSISAKYIVRHSSIHSVGGPGLYTFSVLCSLLLVIVWLIYYLRNNAFKNFYRIGKWYLVKEFLLILTILFTSITYFESYHYGIKLKVRSITSKTVFEKEVSITNQAMAYIPTDRMPYFILNNCEEKRRAKQGYYDEISYADTNRLDYRDPRNLRIREALRRPDAFSYKNYCKLFSTRFDYLYIDSAPAMAAKKNLWIEQHRNDSIRQLLHSFVVVCEKYNISQRLNIDSLTNTVFSRPYNTISTLVPTTEFYRDNFGATQRNLYFIEIFNITNVFDFIDECLPNRRSFRDIRDALMVEGYVALCLSILILCYRRFSKKVFLISIVGTIVWAILIGLLVTITPGSDTSFALFCILLCLLFWLIAWVNLKNQALKTTTGALFNWHVYLAPFVMMFLLVFADNIYRGKESFFYRQPGIIAEEEMQKNYPLLYWINHHSTEIILVNLFIVIAYVALVFNQWAKRWHIMPEE